MGAIATPLVAAIPRASWAIGAPFRFFTPHEATAVAAATARLIPGPKDDIRELGHAGAREAGVVHYIDALLSAFDVHPPRIYAGGPFSGRGGGHTDDFSHFVPLSPIQERYWRAEITALQHQYRAGVVALDTAAKGSFAYADPITQDLVLTEDTTGFRDVMFDHAIEGWLSAPEYGGNHDRSGWTEVAFRGDVVPKGYTAAEVSRSDGFDPIDPTGIVTALLAHLKTVLDG